MVRIIGDIHGKWYDYQVITESVENSIQVGDFGIGFAGDYWHDRVHDYHNENRGHRFIRGNHDNPQKCRSEMNGYIDDGTIENDVMFLGGAWSIDYEWRVEGQDWWRDEELSYEELDRMISLYEVARPSVMITHDCPTSVSYEMFVKQGKTLAGQKQFITRTGEALQRMFEIHQPKFHFFGHWHHTKEMDINGTHFHCLGECDFVDFDLEKKEYVKNG